MAKSSLAAKMKLKPGHRAALIGTPAGYRKELSPLPAGVKLSNDLKGEFDWVQVFVKTEAELKKLVPKAIRALRPESILWISFPKGSSKIQTDLTRDKGWDSLRTVDLKWITLISVNDTWSAFSLRPSDPVRRRRRLARRCVRSFHKPGRDNIPAETHNTMNFGKSKKFVFSAFLFLLLSLLNPSLTAQSKPVEWRAFQFLLGEWIGEGGGSPGQGGGGFTFSYDLQNTIVIRKSYANYPATKDRPAFSHNDLMVMYQERGKTRAVYFDNERHVINYTVTISSDSNSVVFLSDAIPTTPRYRMTYTKSGTESVKIAFEIAPPGQSESFAPYIEAAAHRKK